jgi:hypothetical protein
VISLGKKKFAVLRAFLHAVLEPAPGTIRDKPSSWIYKPYAVREE